ncbi:MAG TPA: hypothetical protein VEQ67_16160, partial [Mycobacterium sp.]|nr:hypothetical protein [Mycobacterium sp.]
TVDPPIAATGAALTATEGAPFSGTVATFTDPDASSTASEYSATVNWGDGSSSAGTVSGASGGPFTVTGSHTYAEEGTYSTSVVIEDVDNPTNSATASGSATVGDAALTAGPVAVISGTEGSSVSGTVGSFSDANPGATAADFTATIAWGDGTSSAGVVTGPTGGPFTVSGTHTYTEEGSYSINVAVSDTGGSTVTLTGTATIADAALTAGPPVVITGTEGSTVSGTVGSFSDANPGATAADFTATIAWGDGTSSAGVVTGPTGGPFTVSGSNLYAEEGSYTIAVTVTDVGGSTVALSGSATIADAALASQCAMPTNTSQVFAGATATFSDQSSTGNAADFSASIDWGDGTSSAGVITGGPGNLPYTVSGSHNYASTGFFTVTTTITDVGGSSTTATCSSVLVFGFASGGSFVIGDRESAAGTNVTFWGAQWWRDNPTSTGSTVPSFKGFAESPFSPACGVQWATDPGNSTPPPAGPLPDHMAVIVTSHYAKSGSAISGETVHIVIVKTNAGYEPNPGHAGTGTVEAQVC